MDPVYEAALVRELELSDELKKVRDFLTLYRTLANSIKLESANTTGTKSDNSTSVELSVNEPAGSATRAEGTADAPTPVRVRVRDNPPPNLVVAAAVEVIREVGRPLTRREIHDALTERGIVVRGADAIKTLGTMLWRSGADQLEQVEGYGYWPLADAPPSEDVRRAMLGGKPASQD